MATARPARSGPGQRHGGEAIEAAAAEPEMSILEDEQLAASLQGWFRFWTAEGFFQAVFW